MELLLTKAFITDGFNMDISHIMDLSGYEYSEGSFPFKKPVKVEGRLYNKAETLHLDIKADYTFSTVCDRCYNPVEIPRSIIFNVVLVHEKIDDDNDELISVPDERFDLDSFILEGILLDVPTKFLCSEECKGLCSICGQNLNLGECNCKKQESPFEILKQYFK